MGCAHRRAARGVYVIAVTRNPESALSAAAAATLQLDYEPMSRATPHTTDYTVTLLALAAVAEVGAGRRITELDPLGERAGAVLPAFLQAAREIVLATEEPDSRARYVFLGGLEAYGTAAYAAAKFHEAGGLTAFAGESENFVHGMNFLLQPSDLVVPIVDPGPAGFRAGELARELPALARTHAVLGSRAAAADLPYRPLADLSDEAPLTFPVLSALAGQSIALAVAETVCPDLERPRAGFPDGEHHLEVQTRLMKEGRTVLPD